MRLTFRPSKLRDARIIARDMREIDRLECACFGRSPEEALRLGYLGSLMCVTAVIDGRPVAMIGVSPESMIDRIGRPWLLASEEAMRATFAWIVSGPALIDQMHEHFPRLLNYVHTDNEASIRWLERIGFCVEPELRHIQGQPFRMFTKEA